MLNVEKEIADIKKRLDLLEKEIGLRDEPSVLGFDLVLPEADINGLHFNEQKVHAMFDKREDGWYCSRNILFLSARNVVDYNRRDILTEYLESDAVKEAFCTCLDTSTESYFSRIKISLLKESIGVRRYNGVACWYWLADPLFGSTTNFVSVSCYAFTNSDIASSVGGCVPIFTLNKD